MKFIRMRRCSSETRGAGNDRPTRIRPRRRVTPARKGAEPIFGCYTAVDLSSLALRPENLTGPNAR